MLRRLLCSLLPLAVPAFAAPDGWREVRVVNETGRTVSGIYVAADTRNARAGFTGLWQGNQLLVLPPGVVWDKPIPPMMEAGEARNVWLHGSCYVRFRVVYDNDAVEERGGLDTCGAESLVLRPGWAQDRAAFPGEEQGAGFRLYNHSGDDIWAVHVYRDGSSPGMAWGPLRNRGHVDIQPAWMEWGRACGYTITVVYAPYLATRRLPQTRSGIDLCSIRHDVVIDKSWLAVESLRPPATIVNGAENDVTIQRLYFSRPGIGAEGYRNVMLAPGERIAIAPPAAGQCRYRVSANGDVGGGAIVDLCARGETVLSGAVDD